MSEEQAGARALHPETPPQAREIAQPAQSLQQQNDRLQLLLNLTTSVTSSLDLKDVLHAIAANFREVMRCDAAGIALPGAEPGTFRLYAADFPGGKGFFRDERIIAPGANSPAKRALETLKPVIANPGDEPPEGYGPPGHGHKMALAEGIKAVCFIPLVNRGRALGNLVLARTTTDAFTQDDVGFLSQAAGQIAIAIENALAYQEISDLKDKLAQEKIYLEDEIRREMHFEQIVGSSPALKHVLELVQTVAPSDSTVLLLGETGTGKELIARAIHEGSRRKERTFVRLNCAAIPTGLLESELFGHERGAFTGAISQKIGRLELADQGTLFLDEVGDIPLEIQPKLLRALQEREFERLGSTRTKSVDVRLIAATDRDLEKMVESREFRSDLYYRLNVFPIRIPPLRERSEDIPLLVSYFAQKYAHRMQRKVESISAASLRSLARWHWPGNVRELENLVERAVVLARTEKLVITVPELADGGMSTAVAGIEFYKRDRIISILKQTKGRVGGADGAAARLGLKRTTLIERMKKLGIEPRRVL